MKVCEQRKSQLGHFLEIIVGGKREESGEEAKKYTVEAAYAASAISGARIKRRPPSYIGREAWSKTRLEQGL